MPIKPYNEWEFDLISLSYFKSLYIFLYNKRNVEELYKLMLAYLNYLNYLHKDNI